MLELDIVCFCWLFSEDGQHCKYVNDFGEKKTNANYQKGTSGLIGTFRNLGERKVTNFLHMLCSWTLSIVLVSSKTESCLYFKTQQNPVSKTMFQNMNRTMYSVQEHNICTNVRPSQTYRSYLLHKEIIYKNPDRPCSARNYNTLCLVCNTALLKLKLLRSHESEKGGKCEAIIITKGDISVTAIWYKFTHI
jgi:hypothetical protein